MSSVSHGAHCGHSFKSEKKAFMVYITTIYCVLKIKSFFKVCPSGCLFVVIHIKKMHEISHLSLRSAAIRSLIICATE